MPIKYFIKDNGYLVTESHSPTVLVDKLKSKIVATVKCKDCTKLTCNRQEEQELFYAADGSIMVFPMCSSFTERNFQIFNDDNGELINCDTYQDAMRYVYDNQDKYNFTLEETLLLNKHMNYIKQEEHKLKIAES